MNDLTIVVNSSDGFEDCWRPFFTLFAHYWPDCTYPIVLNTEVKNYTHPGIPVAASRVALGAPRRLTWSECLALCLDRIETPYIFYLQEDYFLEASVRTDYFCQMLDRLRAGKADVIRIMECGGAGPWHPTEDPSLWEVDHNAKFRISLQAGIWRKDVLRGHLRNHEGPWQFEVFGSTRARRRRGERVLCVNRDLFHGANREIFPYTPTGVVSGKWKRNVVEPLFAAHGIDVDFSIRGFFDPETGPVKRQPIARRIANRVRSLL